MVKGDHKGFACWGEATPSRCGASPLWILPEGALASVSCRRQKQA